MEGDRVEAAVAEATRARFLAPSWVLLDDARGVTARDLASGAELRLEVGSALGSAPGSAPTSAPGSRASWWAALPGRLRALSAFEPELAPLAGAWEQHAPVPLDRAALLAGEGFELLFVELTARCNEACLHCYAEASPSASAALDGATLRAVLEDARVLGFRRVQLTGGDPLLSPWLVPAARWAAALGFEQVEIFTNGLALTADLLRRLRGLPVAFACSCYSFDPAVHDRITQRPGSQRRTVRALRRVLAAGFPLRVGIIALDENRAQVEATREWLERLGVPAHAIGVSAQRQVGRGTVTALDPASATVSSLPSGGDAACERVPFTGKAAVAADGTVYPCIFSRTLPLGSVHRQSLRAILTAPVALPGELAALGERAAAWADRLACGECRVRAALLAEARPSTTPGPLESTVGPTA
ncbi:MAG: radical SAM protein [Proteobacteria bacterium]|nr:radical SAM protein [Pseudomonadota bacterium]